MTVLKSLFSTEGFSLARALRSFSRASEQRTCKKYSSKKRLALMAMVDTLRTFVFSLQTLPKYLFHTLDKENFIIIFFYLWAKSKCFLGKDEEFLLSERKRILDALSKCDPQVSHFSAGRLLHLPWPRKGRLRCVFRE